MRVAARSGVSVATRNGPGHGRGADLNALIWSRKATNLRIRHAFQASKRRQVRWRRIAARLPSTPLKVPLFQAALRRSAAALTAQRVCTYRSRLLCWGCHCQRGHGDSHNGCRNHRRRLLGRQRLSPPLLWRGWQAWPCRPCRPRCRAKTSHSCSCCSCRSCWRHRTSTIRLQRVQ